MVCAAIKDNDAAVQRQRILYSRLPRFSQAEKLTVMDNWTDGVLNMSVPAGARQAQARTRAHETNGGLFSSSGLKAARTGPETRPTLPRNPLSFASKVEVRHTS